MADTERCYATVSAMDRTGRRIAHRDCDLFKRECILEQLLREYSYAKVDRGSHCAEGNADNVPPLDNDTNGHPD